MAVYLYIGSFCPNSEGGYSVYRFDQDSGSAALAAEDIFPEISAGIMTWDPRRGILYCTDERASNPQFEKGGGGRVFALMPDPETGLLTKRNESLSYGVRPSFAAADASGHYLLVTNFGSSKHAGVPVTKILRGEDGSFRVAVDYEDATTALFSLEPDGSIGKVLDVIVHGLEGDPCSPRIPHAHCVKASPGGSLFAVCEMGTDRIYMLKIDRDRNRLAVCGGKPYRFRAGYGPRYCAFHPTRPFLFVNTEDIPVVTSFRYTPEGQLEEICTVNVMPEGETPTPELHSGFTMSQDGRFLYSLMRKYNIISVFSVDQESGALQRVQTFPLKGSHPKDCMLSPNGKWLAVANRRSNDAEILRVSEDGTLTDPGIRLPRRAAGLVFFLEL